MVVYMKLWTITIALLFLFIAQPSLHAQSCLSDLLGAIELPKAKECVNCLSPVGSLIITTNNDTVCISTADSLSAITLNGNGNCIYICGRLKVGEINGFGSNNKLVINPGSVLSVYTDLSTYQNLNIIADYGEIDFLGGASNFYAPLVVSNASTVIIQGDFGANSGGTPGGSIYLNGGSLTVTGTTTLNTRGGSTFPDICVTSNSSINLNNLVVNAQAPMRVQAEVSVLCFTVSGSITLNNILTNDPLKVCKRPGAFYTNPFLTNWGPQVTVLDDCSDVCNLPLPLKLLSFKATDDNGAVRLRWWKKHER
jgi:hypothetical protein